MMEIPRLTIKRPCYIVGSSFSALRSSQAEAIELGNKAASIILEENPGCQLEEIQIKSESEDAVVHAIVSQPWAHEAEVVR